MARKPRTPKTPTGHAVSMKAVQSFPFTFDHKAGEWWEETGVGIYREFILNSQVARLRKHWGAQHETIHSHVLKCVWRHQRPEGVVYVVADREGTMINIEVGATDPLACAQWAFSELAAAKEAPA